MQWSSGREVTGSADLLGRIRGRGSAKSSLLLRRSMDSFMLHEVDVEYFCARVFCFLRPFSQIQCTVRTVCMVFEH
ncbi:hypothetical protein EMPG_12924 [Blastomyces silverae]|uniref:Uncharacterized protein n=1 Tax=Blastomyces silverae TaxID=2060906 RepID=A0A0H1BKT3_9EURO|nr:hypothetical protein EMPG_12924 [Blastomyces silverae]